mmetsp:Transcript_154/g.483  ORF Transcript_154/g.483 Transcript_154/m.483 type:complete len:265 (-) Transcript_154:393-1187(-)
MRWRRPSCRRTHLVMRSGHHRHFEPLKIRCKSSRSLTEVSALRKPRHKSIVDSAAVHQPDHSLAPDVIFSVPRFEIPAKDEFLPKVISADRGNGMPILRATARGTVQRRSRRWNPTLAQIKTARVLVILCINHKARSRQPPNANYSAKDTPPLRLPKPPPLHRPTGDRPQTARWQYPVLRAHPQTRGTCQSEDTVLCKKPLSLKTASKRQRLSAYHLAVCGFRPHHQSVAKESLQARATVPHQCQEPSHDLLLPPPQHRDHSCA